MVMSCKCNPNIVLTLRQGMPDTGKTKLHHSYPMFSGVENCTYKVSEVSDYWAEQKFRYGIGQHVKFVL